MFAATALPASAVRSKTLFVAVPALAIRVKAGFYGAILRTDRGFRDG